MSAESGGTGRPSTGNDWAARELARPAVESAPLLLGALLTRRDAEGAVTVRITEVEAYEGARDPGSHAYRGPTPRTRPMFEAAGHVYVYRSYGIHLCLNLVCGHRGAAAGCLVRAGEVVEGEDLARRRRAAVRRPGTVEPRSRELARGPGNLGLALGVRLEDSGRRVDEPPFALHPPAVPVARDLVVRGPRVGLALPGGAPAFDWRFSIAADPTVSRYTAHRSLRDADAE